MELDFSSVVQGMGVATFPEWVFGDQGVTVTQEPVHVGGSGGASVSVGGSVGGS